MSKIVGQTRGESGGSLIYRVGRDNLYTRFSGPFLSGVFGVLRHPQFFRYAV